APGPWILGRALLAALALPGRGPGLAFDGWGALWPAGPPLYRRLAGPGPAGRAGPGAPGAKGVFSWAAGRPGAGPSLGLGPGTERLGPQPEQHGCHVPRPGPGPE